LVARKEDDLVINLRAFVGRQVPGYNYEKDLINKDSNIKSRVNVLIAQRIVFAFSKLKRFFENLPGYDGMIEGKKTIESTLEEAKRIASKETVSYLPFFAK
jgi:hypothetical protein